MLELRKNVSTQYNVFIIKVCVFDCLFGHIALVAVILRPFVLQPLWNAHDMLYRSHYLKQVCINICGKVVK